ncbi:unnamed protein product [Rhizoctonia solani]|uniref:Protein kinase domain-containing protein n=1 Tax=Rhizoctonia solani TaxID=456999 RepID=A0A8H3CCH9_9AGAM|nr:unnamed protein product [Rhizoctonia solani]
MQQTRFRTKRNQLRRHDFEAKVVSQLASPSPAPLRAKLDEYFRDSYNDNDPCGGPSSSDVQESTPAGIVLADPQPVYTLHPSSQQHIETPPLWVQYPLTKPRRKHIPAGRKRIQLTSPFSLLVDYNVPFEADHSAVPLFQLEPNSSNIKNKQLQENIHPLYSIHEEISESSPCIDNWSRDSPIVLDEPIAPMGAGPLRAFDMMVYDTSKVLKLIQFDISNPIEKDTPGIIIESLVSLECDAGDPFSNMLATSHFLAYARAPRPLEQDTGPIYLESFLGGFHTWLTLPSVFGRNTSIADMASKGDYLAVTTSGGGALVWEIPKPTGQVQFLPIIRLQILPETPGLKKVKWHSIGTVGFASSNQVYLLDLHEVQVTFGGLPVVLDKLKYVARVFEVLPPVISFGFDYRSDSVAILSFGGSISFFVIHGHYRIWKATIQGPGQPYSLDIYDWGMLVGWKQGSVFQLFTPFSTNIISTFQFTDSTDLVAKTNAESHTCLCYDSQIRVLWVAHSARSSILAVHIPVEADNPRPESIHMNAYQVFEQIVEIPTPTPITGISLAASADGLAVVNVYVTNASGVDRIIFNQDALESSHIMRNLTVGTLLEERSQTEVPNSSYPATRLDYLGHQIGATPPEVNQPKISTLHSVRVNWDGKEDIIAKPVSSHAQKWFHYLHPYRKRPENIVEFDVSYEHDSIKAKADCITITPLAQLTANSIGNQFPELLAFDHGHVPGPIFTVNAFLAYGMANGRIGLVFRHNGAQAILKLPAVYGRSASAVDLTIINNYLACITDSGGAIVWNIPNTYSQRSGASHAPLLQIQPSGLRKAKWRHEGSLALMSDSEVCLLDILQLQATFEGLYVPWKNLLQFIQRYSVPSFIVNFTFDTKNTTLATISIDSVISLWSMETPQIIWQGRIPGKGEPSSIILMDNGSTDEMFKCLIFHGCPNLTESMDPDAYSKGFVIAGGFGDIWKGKLCDGTTVAIKVWRFRTLNEDVGKDIKRAMREIYNWSKLDHDNIHKLLGVVVFDGRLGMVSKWMEKGNLQHYLQKNPLTDRYPLCIQVARGVEYLHKKNMIHGDLKAINILVSSDHGLKLTDFDHSIMSECTLQFSETTRMGGGTLRWMVDIKFHILVYVHTH